MSTHAELIEAAELLINEYEPRETLEDRSWWQRTEGAAILKLARHVIERSKSDEFAKRQAAEYRSIANDIGGRCGPACTREWSDMAEGWRRLAEAWERDIGILTSTAAAGDEGELPVTEEWLRSLAGAEEEVCGDGTKVFVWHDESGTLRLQLERYDEQVWEASFYGHDSWPDDIYVRQQVLDIMKALCITTESVL